MSGGLSRGGGGSKFPFTPSQWQELEHQALIYKHMVAGVPIPHDLLLAVKRSLDSPLSSQNFFPAAAYQNSHMGWNPYQMGYGKRLDPEPGRCRRTDGKKWRCSKEAYPDSKYCERHMHRGKNRSRKPVEVLTTTAAAAACATITTAETGSTAAAQIGVNPTTASYISSMNKNIYSSLSSFQPPLGSSDSYDLLYHHSSSPRPPGMSLSSQDTNTHLLLESGSLRDRRYLQGVKGDIGEHASFNGARRGYTSPGSSMDEQWQLNQFKHGGEDATTSFSQQRQGYPYLELKSEVPKPEKQQTTHEGYVWGRDFDCELTMRVEREIDPQKTRDSWNESSSTTQLSISMPTSSHHDFFLSNSRSP